MRKNHQQIDVIKGLAIVSVVMLHSLHKDVLLDTYAIYHIWQAVPLFMIIMGLNTGMTASVKAKGFSELYTKSYFLKRFSRIIIPLLLTFVLSVLVGLVAFFVTGESKIKFSAYNFIGLLPVTGRGNYFITLLLQTILLLPLLGLCFRRWPYLTIFLLVVLEVLFLLLSNHIKVFDDDLYLYDAAFPRYFSAIAFGLVLSGVVTAPFRMPASVPLFIVAAASIMCLYQILYNQMVISYIRPEWQTQQVLSYGYAALIVLLLFLLLPNQSGNLVLKFFSKLGKASFHIFLIQTVYFGITAVVKDVFMALSVCIPLGYLFYKYESRMKIHSLIKVRAKD